jgi:thiamine biosynthesis lipoprotein
MGTSGSNVQFFRHEGVRYGHILDPRTARPAAGLLSATVIAPTAAMADALSTAFFVLGVEKARELCDNQPLIGALLIPPPDRGGRLTPVVCGISEDCLFLDSEQVEMTSQRLALRAGPAGMMQEGLP